MRRLKKEAASLFPVSASATHRKEPGARLFPSASKQEASSLPSEAFQAPQDRRQYTVAYLWGLHLRITHASYRGTMVLLRTQPRPFMNKYSPKFDFHVLRFY